MQAAQRLYENGHITYMRTDSTTLSADALSTARALIKERYGPQTLPGDARTYSKKVKNAQEAHEAIRPAGQVWKSPEQLAEEVTGDATRLYELIWRRTIASQMIDATGQTVTIRLEGSTTDERDVEFTSSGTVITQPGFRLAYVQAEDDDEEPQLPNLSEGDAVSCAKVTARDHDTSPPARYTEATLVRLSLIHI